MKDKQYYIYLMTNYSNSVIYTGVTSDIVRRVSEHKNKSIKGFTSKYNTSKLVYFESVADIESAIMREKQLKAGPRKKKIDLIEINNPEYRDLYSELL